MPGLVGVVGDSAGVARVRAAIDSLLHFPRYRSAQTQLGTRIALGQVWRDQERFARDWAIDPDAGIALLLNGTAFGTGLSARRLHATDLLQGYLRDGALDARRLDGAFVIVLADLRRGSVTVCNDRLGTLPLYYTQVAGTVGFAPEAKALFAAFGLQMELSKSGIVSFLTCGYCLGRSTLFTGIHCLTPGSTLEIAIDSGGCAVRRYWKMVYAPARGLGRRRAAEDALYEGTRRAHELTVRDSPGGYDLLLSGGWDSRGILAFLNEMGRPPKTAVSWGRTKDIPQSDPYLAERLAERYALPFKFIAYDSDQLIDNARSWCLLSELANDNIGWFAEGASLLAGSYATSADFTLVGDETWGWHGHPRNEQEARNAVLPATLPPLLAQCLAPPVREECFALYEAQIDAVLGACANDHPADRRDFLYVHGRVARFIFALGYYKELAVEIRRPFLSAHVLDVIAQVPHRLRAEKNLYVSMLGRYFPELAAFPQRRANSLPEWSRDMRAKPALRRFFLELLDERALGGVLGSLLDGAAFDRLKQSFFDGAVPAAPRVSRSVGRRLPLRLRQRIRAAGLYPGSRHMPGGDPARGRVDLIRSVALLSLLQSTFASARSPQSKAVAGRKA